MNEESHQAHNDPRGRSWGHSWHRLLFVHIVISVAAAEQGYLLDLAAFCVCIFRGIFSGITSWFEEDLLMRPGLGWGGLGWCNNANELRSQVSRKKGSTCSLQEGASSVHAGGHI